MAPAHSASASAPLHASVTSIGNAGAPIVAEAMRPCHCVNGSTACVSTQCSLSRPNTPRLPAIAAAATLRGRERAGDWRVSVGTADLLDRNIACAEQRAELVDCFETAQPCRARKNVDVDGACLRPGVDHGVGFLEDEHAGQAGA